MLARDLMTTNLSVIRPSSTSAEVARTLLGAGVSAVPVVDDDGRPIGVVSEWDLIGQHAPDRISKREHWLSQLAQGQPLAADFLQAIDPTAHTAAEIMQRPAITVADTADMNEVARLIAEHHIKRVFITRDGRLVGVVSRIDLVRAHLAEGETSEPRPRRAPLDPAPRPSSAPQPIAESAPVPPTANGPSAAALRQFVEAARAEERVRRVTLDRMMAEARRARVEALSRSALGDDGWRALLERAVGAASRGDSELLVLRFPSELCSDGGRAINAPDPNWPETLRGEAADIFERWQRDLKPQGYGLSAQILDFPGGFPGDAGLTLSWGG